jgi:acyl carrier protein phosphodiesterase
MNWLAHLLLSQPDVESRLGNLLADLVKGTERDNLSDNIKLGIKNHHQIDAFTDSHLVVYRSKQRISSKYRRFAGILIDGFYDHFLAKNWSMYYLQPLNKFTAEIYESFQAYPEPLPEYASQIITRMANEDWLGSYRSLAGIEYLLTRLSHRFSQRFKNRSDFHLELAINELTNNYSDLESDFFEFFPELSEYVKLNSVQIPDFFKKSGI